jgi:hypothetical protein
MEIGVGPVSPLGLTGDELKTGLHVQTTIPFQWWIPKIPFIGKIPLVNRIPKPGWPERLDFLRPKLQWRGDLQYEQLAGPDRPYRVIAGEAVATRYVGNMWELGWPIMPYLVGGVGVYNTQFYLHDPEGTQHPASADVRTNPGLSIGLGLSNQLAGYPISLEAKYRWIRHALSDETGHETAMRALTVALRYNFQRSYY